MEINYIYESILKDYLNLNQYNVEKLSTYKESVKALRASYKSDTCIPKYDTDKDRDSYMLAYFPYYGLLTSEVIEKIRNHIDIKEKMNVSVFGCGPAPEIIGINNQLKNVQRITYNLFDYENGWRNQREFAKKYIKNNYSSNVIFSEISGCDLLSLCEDCQYSNVKCKEKLKSTDLFIMQNCLNHMKNEEDFIKKMIYLVKNAKKGSIFIIIDLEKYDISKRLLKKIKIENSQKCRKLNEGYNQFLKINKNSINITIREHLFTGENGLIPKTTVNYIYLAMQKI